MMQAEVLSLLLGYTKEGHAVLAAITFSHKLRPGMLRRLATILGLLADVADDELPPLMGRAEHEPAEPVQ